MSRAASLAVLLTLVAALSALGADTEAKKATVTLSLNDTSRFTLTLDDKGQTYSTDVKDGKFKVQVNLNFHVAILPKGYTRTTERAVAEFTYRSDQLHNAKACEQAKGEIKACLPPSVPKIAGDQGPHVNSDPPALLDQDDNRSIALGAIVPANVVNNYGAKFSPISISEGTWDTQKPVFAVKIWDVTNEKGTELRMAEAVVTWKLTIALDLNNLPAKSDLLRVTVGNGDQTSAPANDQAQGETKAQTKDQTGGTTVLSAFGSALGLPAAAMESGPGYDIVAGFAAGDTGPNAFAGVIGSFEKKDDDLPWYSLRRVGILGGRTGGTPTQWLIAPSFKIGGRTHFFVGEGFSSSDGNDRQGLVLGLAYSVLDAVARLTGSERQAQTTVTQKVEVTVDPEATVPTRLEPRSATMAVVYLYPAKGPNRPTIDDTVVLLYQSQQQGQTEGDPLPVSVRLDTNRRVLPAGPAGATTGPGEPAVDTLRYGLEAFENGDKLCGAKLPNETRLALTVNGVKVDSPLTLLKGQVYYAEISRIEVTTTPPALSPPRTPEPGPRPDNQSPPTPTPTTTGPQWWLRGQAEPRPGQMVSIVITATSEKKVGIGTLQSRYSVPAQVDADGFFAVLLPQLDEGQPYRIEITREGSDAPFVVDGVTPEKGKNLPITLPELRKPAPK